MTCARTEEGDEDTKVSQTAQWKTSTLVMWSFSWRALKKRDLLFQPLMEDDVFGGFFLKVFTFQETVLYGAAKSAAFV